MRVGRICDNANLTRRKYTTCAGDGNEAKSTYKETYVDFSSQETYIAATTRIAC